MPCLPGPCVVDGCDHVGQIVARGMCSRHYSRWKRHGDPEHLERHRGDREAGFWQKVEKSPDGCWEWQGARHPKGYGHFWDGNRVARAHGYAYELLVGPIPAGLQIDHLCNNPSCVNPDHLEPVTLQENVRRRDARRKGELVWVN